MTARRSAALLAATALAAALTACAPASTPTPSPTPTGFASEEEAFAAAEATYRAYVDALNQVDLSDPATFEPLFAITTGELNDIDRKSFSQLHADGAVVSGATKILSITPLDHKSTKTRLAICLDVSAVELKDADGNSLVQEDRPDLRAETATVERTPDGESKLASIGDGVDGIKCDE